MVINLTEVLAEAKKHGWTHLTFSIQDVKDTAFWMESAKHLATQKGGLSEEERNCIIDHEINHALLNSIPKHLRSIGIPVVKDDKIVWCEPHVK